MSMITDIKDFHEKFGLEYNGKPRSLPGDMPDFRRDFMYEELQEYCDASVIDDKEEMFDALIDLMYVTLGTAYLHGFDFEEGWARVHAANMAKIRAVNTESAALVKAMGTGRDPTYDVVKPEGWTPATLADLL